MKTPADGVACSGLIVLIIGVILSNLAVSKMAKAVKLSWTVGFKSSAADRRSRQVIRTYRAKHGNGPLFRNLVAAYGLAAIGAIVMIFGPIFLKR